MRVCECACVRARECVCVCVCTHTVELTGNLFPFLTHYFKGVGAAFPYSNTLKGFYFVYFLVQNRGILHVNFL